MRNGYQPKKKGARKPPAPTNTPHGGSARKRFYRNCNCEKCGGRCSYPQCRHTADPRFAKHSLHEPMNFIDKFGGPWEVEE